MLPDSYWASTCRAALPAYTAFMISVRQVGDLPPASFRFSVTQDTLAFGYILPAVWRIRDFHPLECAPAGRTDMIRRGHLRRLFFVLMAKSEFAGQSGGYLPHTEIPSTFCAIQPITKDTAATPKLMHIISIKAGRKGSLRTTDT